MVNVCVRRQFHYCATGPKKQRRRLRSPACTLCPRFCFFAPFLWRLTFATQTTVTLCWCQQTAEADRGVKVMPKHDSLHCAATHETRISGRKAKCEKNYNLQNVKEKTQLNHSPLRRGRENLLRFYTSPKIWYQLVVFSFINPTLPLPWCKPLTQGWVGAPSHRLPLARPVVDLPSRQTAASRSHYCDNCTNVVRSSSSPPCLEDGEKIGSILGFRSSFMKGFVRSLPHSFVVG